MSKITSDEGVYIVAEDKVDLIEFLKNIDDDDFNPECKNREFCPKHNNCGICRFEYMKEKNWLNPELTK